jgi:hypothetical protein
MTIPEEKVVLLPRTAPPPALAFRHILSIAASLS